MQNRNNNIHEISGKTITFYSYKGGVGRTMSLVNIAFLMLKQQKKVLLIDWDLEAPGLHTFFYDTNQKEELGMVDLITDLTSFLQVGSNNNDEGYIRFLKGNLNKYISKKRSIENKKMSVDIIKAGKFDADYTNKLNAIDWIELYKDSPSFFRTLSIFLEKKYDYILIDSRTGLADTSGVCTMLMPQILVLVFSLNNQNINGIIDVARQSADYRFNSNDFRSLTILPLPSRIDNENPEELAFWINHYKKEFEEFFKETYLLDDCNLENYFNISKIPYKPNYAYGEKIPVLFEDAKNDLFISYHYSQFFKLIEESLPIWEILTPEQLEVNRKKSEEYYNLGMHFYNAKNYEKAIIEFNKSCKLNSSFELAYYNWGNVLFDYAKSENSVLLIEESFDKYSIAYDINPKNELILSKWGNALSILASFKNEESLLSQSIEKFQKAAVINSKNCFSIEDLRRRMHVPDEIKNHGLLAIENYFESIENNNAVKLNEARIIIMGEKGAGKTCLARRLVNPNASMTTENESTAGIDTILWRLDKESTSVRIWDFAGHTVTHAVHQLFLSERCLYIIVYDGRTEERNRLEYWLNHIKNFGGNSTAIILINKRDQHQIDVPINSLKEQYSIEGLYAFSIKDDVMELAEFRNVISKYIKNNPSWNMQLIPASYYKVKEELEELFIRGNRNKCSEYIKRDEFDRIAERNGIERKESLLNHLHALGVSLWYKEMEEFNTLVLNPEWISNGIYQIINWVNFNKKHSITLKDLSVVFKDTINRYPKEKYQFFIKLMTHFELAYETEKGNALIIPHLLKEDRLSILPNFPVEDSLMLRYRAEQPLPPNTISRFIVRHNNEIKKVDNGYLVWRYGVVLEDGKGSTALVREEDRTISVSVKGESKTEFLSTLRETLNNIFNSYQSNKPELQYRVERFGQIPADVEKRNPLWLPDTKILNHSRNNIPYYEDITGQNIDLYYTVNNYNITAQTVLSGQGIVFTDHSIHNTFNFYNCNIDLQGKLNDLARMVKKVGIIEVAKELEDVAEVLEQAEQCKTPEEVKKKGIVNSLKRLVQDLSDEDSKLHKTVRGIRKGMSIAQDITQNYNNIAQWQGLPLVPKPFLKKGDKE